MQALQRNFLNQTRSASLPLSQSARAEMCPLSNLFKELHASSQDLLRMASPLFSRTEVQQVGPCKLIVFAGVRT